ncbi:uncharacterized protein LOC121383439 isoform X1 [Gigantopelta aegis]|uniref:uncharacterized protein LOC121383439 isoform X1 n=1 Tax=Gigantopelta aegis TaxID=1735272 RepID=UPI001B887745|nr:uncharacterized protein LOC121383439 isoform X1 [Gigantopelta aegis]
MEKQYSVRFFTSLLEAVQKLCREYLDFDQCVDVSGYLALEIDNYKKERFVISELLQSTGDVMSESYCTKAFKTQRRYVSNRTDDSSVLKERNSNFNSRLADEQRAASLSLSSSKHVISPRNSFNHGKNVSSHTVVRADQSYHSDQSAMSGNYYHPSTSSSSDWTPATDSLQSLNPADSGGTSSLSKKRSISSSVDSPSAKTLKTESISMPHSLSSQYSNQDPGGLSHNQTDGDTASDTATTHGSLTDIVHLPPDPVEVKEELDDCVLIDSADEADDRDLQNVLSADDSSSSMYDSSGLPLSFPSPGEGMPGMSDQPGSSQQKCVPMNPILMMRTNMKCSYSSESLAEAIQAVMEKRMSARAASEFYHIPRATIYDKLPRPSKQQAKTSFLTQEEEEGLADFIVHSYERGCPLTKIEVLKKVEKICHSKSPDGLSCPVMGQNVSQQGRPKGPDYFWLTNFCKRHPRVNGLFLSNNYFAK